MERTDRISSINIKSNVVGRPSGTLGAEIDFANHIRHEQGLDLRPALIEAGKERLRPILMTTFAMIFGMLPIALATGNASEFKSGMAWVIIVGLTSSMLLTLVVVPVVYYGFHRIAEKISVR